MRNSSSKRIWWLRKLLGLDLHAPTSAPALHQAAPPPAPTPHNRAQVPQSYQCAPLSGGEYVVIATAHGLNIVPRQPSCEEEVNR